MFVDNGFPVALSAQLGGELPKCRIRIADCNSFAPVILNSDDTLITLLVVGPVPLTEKQELQFDKALAHHPAELECSGQMHVPR